MRADDQEIYEQLHLLTEGSGVEGSSTKLRSALRERWLISDDDTAERVEQKITCQLECLIARTSFDDITRKHRATQSQIRDQLRVAYNIAEIPDEAKSETLVRRLQWFGGIGNSHLSIQTYYRYYRNAFQILAEASRTKRLDYEHLKAEMARRFGVEMTSGDFYANSYGDNPLFVNREDISAQFNAAFNSGFSAIILSGLPGMGKSWLARALAKLPNGSRAPRILVTSGKPHEPDIQAALLRQKIETRSPIIDNPNAYLALLLTHENAPSVVVLDNLDSADEIRRILPDGVRSRLVITARSAGDNLPEDWAILAVGEMSRDEAVALIHRRLPGVSEDEAAALADDLHNYPLVLSYACTLIKRRKLSVSQFVADATVDTLGVTGRIATAHDDNLASVVLRLIQLLKAENEHAYKLLGSIAFACVVPAFSEDYLWRCFKADYEDGSYTSFTQAIETLEQYSFTETRAVSGWSQSATIVIHPFVQTIVRQLIKSELHMASQCFRRVFDSYVVDRQSARAKGKEPSEEARLWEAINTMLIYALRAVERWCLYEELAPEIGHGPDGAGVYVDDMLADIEYLHVVREALVSDGLLPSSWADWLWRRIGWLIDLRLG